MWFSFVVSFTISIHCTIPLQSLKFHFVLQMLCCAKSHTIHQKNVTFIKCKFFIMHLWKIQKCILLVYVFSSENIIFNLILRRQWEGLNLFLRNPECISLLAAHFVFIKIVFEYFFSTISFFWWCVVHNDVSFKQYHFSMQLHCDLNMCVCLAYFCRHFYLHIWVTLN